MNSPKLWPNLLNILMVLGGSQHTVLGVWTDPPKQRKSDICENLVIPFPPMVYLFMTYNDMQCVYFDNRDLDWHINPSNRKNEYGIFKVSEVMQGQFDVSVSPLFPMSVDSNGKTSKIIHVKIIPGAPLLIKHACNNQSDGKSLSKGFW